MNPRVDVTALVVGLVLLLGATLGLWTSFASVNWAWVGVAVPVCLVLVGLVGLLVSRPKP